jgi:predicted nucleotidyltransferase
MVTKNSAIEEVKNFVNLCRKNGLSFSKIILFGSIVQGKAHENSDIDLLLFSDDFSENVLGNQELLSPFMRQHYNLDIKAFPTYRF